MQSGLFALLLTLNVAPAVGVGAAGAANPKIPFYGYGAIVAYPSFPIAGRITDCSERRDEQGC
eukprot:2964237-Rhodomonas_salina.2